MNESEREMVENERGEGDRKTRTVLRPSYYIFREQVLIARAVDQTSTRWSRGIGCSGGGGGGDGDGGDDGVSGMQ